MKVRNVNGTNRADCGQRGRPGWIFGGAGSCALGGMILRMFDGLGRRCRMPIPSRRPPESYILEWRDTRTTHEDVSLCVIRVFEKRMCAAANQKRPLTEIREAGSIPGSRTVGERLSALRRLLEATSLLAATNVAGLGGCMQLQSLDTENQERRRRPRFV
jgi:hypothetical protein